MHKKQTEVEIMEKYEISFSTLRRIIWSHKVIIVEEGRSNISTYWDLLNSSSLITFIEWFIKENKRNLTTLDI